jgi:hypothetical protein
MYLDHQDIDTLSPFFLTFPGFNIYKILVEGGCFLVYSYTDVNFGGVSSETVFVKP